MEKYKVSILGSGKHVHLCEKDLKILFGQDAVLNPKKMLGDGIMGQFLSDKKVIVQGPKGSAEFSVLGPLRKQSQIEVSYTEGRQLGFRPPLADSGHLEDTDGCTLVGPNGKVELEKGLMVARRHIHMNPTDAKTYGFNEGDLVKVEIEGPRGMVLSNCKVGIKEKEGRSVMHIDFDEMNAAGLTGDAFGWVIKE